MYDGNDPVEKLMVQNGGMITEAESLSEQETSGLSFTNGGGWPLIGKGYIIHPQSQEVSQRAGVQVEVSCL